MSYSIFSWQELCQVDIILQVRKVKLRVLSNLFITDVIISRAVSLISSLNSYLQYVVYRKEIVVVTTQESPLLKFIGNKIVCFFPSEILKLNNGFTYKLYAMLK